MILTSGTQKLQGRTVNHDKHPWRFTYDDVRTMEYDPPAYPTPDDDSVYDPRPEFAVQDNPILAAFREYPDHSVESAQNWLDAIRDPDGGTQEIRELLSDSLGAPRGPGWEDHYLVWLQDVGMHATRVFNRLINLNR